jgi:exopolysaccharide production protein ExoQ
MTPSLALVVFSAGVIGLFYLDRDKSVRTSKALWLAVPWMWINASRSIAAWLAVTPAKNSRSSDSPLDQFVGAVLIASGIIVIAWRNRECRMLLKRGWPILVYFSYCLLSAFWSDFPGQGSKRWIRAVGDLVMVMVVATDPQPTAALKRFFSRVGFLLLPASILMLKYYPDLSHGYDQWGLQMNTGVATDKNMLGVGTFVLTLGAVWQVLRLLKTKDQANRGRHLLAQGTLVCFGISLLFIAHSATSGACFTLGVIIMIATSLPMFRRRPAMVHALVVAILLLGLLTAALGGGGAAAKAMGRKADLTGRTEVWHLLIPMEPNPILGAGFESFWFGPRLEKIWLVDGGIFHGINEAHNGYLEVYLNLGFIGVGLIALIFLRGYRNAVDAFRRDPTFGNLPLAYILTAAIYSITEAGFRMQDPIWFFLLLSVVARSAPAVSKPSGTGPQIGGTPKTTNGRDSLGLKLVGKDGAASPVGRPVASAGAGIAK